MSDLLEISNTQKNKENVDDMVRDLLEIKKALDYSMEKDSEHEFIYSIIKFAKINPEYTISELIKMSLEDWSIN